MKRLYYANATDTPPLPPKNPSYGYPQDGDRSLNKLPTVLGSYWHHMITEEFMNVIEGAGIEPDENNLHQLADIFEDFRSRAFKAEGYAGDAEDWANKAKEFAQAAQVEANSKVAMVREEGEAQIAAVTAATASSQEEIDAKAVELEQKLQDLIAALDAKGGEQVNLVKIQAQEILEAIQLSKRQVEELVNSAGYSMRYLADAHEGTNLTAALCPATSARPGDHVINANGEVFELLELNGTEIVLGSVLATYGDIGPMGPSPTVSIEVNMVGSGETASVEKSGPDASPHFKMNIPKGDKGDPFVYSDFTEEQLLALKGPKGDKGDPIFFEDLTIEQKEELKGPKGDPGENADVSNLIPKTGDRGLLNGYQQAGNLVVGSEEDEGIQEGVTDDAFVVTEDRVTVYASRLPDISTIDVTDPAKTLTILPAENRMEASQGWWTKVIRVSSASEIIEFKALKGNAGDLQFSYPWCWDQEKVPEITSGDYLVMFWTGGHGIVKKLPAYFTE